MLDKRLKRPKEWENKNTKRQNNLPKTRLILSRVLTKLESKRRKKHTKTRRTQPNKDTKIWKIWLDKSMMMPRIKHWDKKEKPNERSRKLRNKSQVKPRQSSREWDKSQEKKQCWSQLKTYWKILLNMPKTL